MVEAGEQLMTLRLTESEISNNKVHFLAGVCRIYDFEVDILRSCHLDEPFEE